MTDLLALEYVEIDLPYCSLTYGQSPCQASLGSPATGTIKCFNSRATCQDLVNIDLVPTTVRFCRQTEYLPRDIDALPYLTAVDYSPAIVSLGENLGQRAELKFSLADHPHSDVGPGFDKYYSERTYDPYSLGTIFGKLRSRYPSLRGVAVRWILGFVGQALSAMETRHFFIESFNGPSADGKFEIIAKDALKFLDGDRAVAPLPSAGTLIADISETAEAIDLSPAGVGASYPASGYVNLGGNEIAAFTNISGTPGGIDADTEFMAHADGEDGSTSVVDSSSNAIATGTASGQANIDTSNSKFGGASMAFDGTGDFWSWSDNAAWTPTGNLTFDCWIWITSLASDRTIATMVQDGNNLWFWDITSAGVMRFQVRSGGVTIVSIQSTTAGQFATGVWIHVAVERNGSDWRLYKDGAIHGTLSDADTIPNFTNTFRIGADQTGASGFFGWIDEFRISHVARYGTAAFTPMLVPYRATDYDDALQITRGELGSVAASHGAGDRVQIVLRYSGESPADIISDLITTYTDTPAGYVPLAEWQTECNTYLNRVYTFSIAEPTPVAQIISELVVQAALALWDDNVGQQIHLQVIRGVAVDAETYDDSVIRDDSFSVTDQPERRVSQVMVYYGQIDPTKRVDDPDNYRSLAHVTDADAEAAHGISIRKIFARGIAAAGLSVAQRLADLNLARYKVAPRKFALDLQRRSIGDPVLGAGRNVEFWNLQDPTGARETVPTQIIRLKADPATYDVELEEMRIDAPASDLSNRQITISSNTNNINLRSVHDTIYPAVLGNQSPAEQITCTIATDVIVGSTSTGVPAFDVGSWPTGVDISIIVLGRIEGRGGAGGIGGDNVFIIPGAGSVGGTAFYTRYAITLTDTNGEIWGGGGGGGGGGGVGGGAGGLAGGGGGGAGQLPGLGGAGYLAGNPGTDGTTEAGGAGGLAPGSPAVGGSGGGPGLSGATGSGSGPGSGGAAGKAIDGISFVTTSGSAGDRRGGTIN